MALEDLDYDASAGLQNGGNQGKNGCAIYSVSRPARQTAPLVFNSPHSGRHYPQDFVRRSKLSAQSIRRSEDAFVDELFARIPNYGAPLISAVYARAFIDTNREPYALDPEMFSGPLPDFVNSKSPRIAEGLGTIPRLVANGLEIYGDKLEFDEACQRIKTIYRPYHRALDDLMMKTRDRFGMAVLIDCHSMPSGVMAGHGRNQLLPDIVVGNLDGASCSQYLTNLVAGFFADRGYRVVRNVPFSGGFNTRKFGRPADGYQALQIEINRALYINEATLRRHDGFALLRQDISDFADRICREAGRWAANAQAGTSDKKGPLRLAEVAQV